MYLVLTRIAGESYCKRLGSRYIDPSRSMSSKNVILWRMYLWWSLCTLYLLTFPGEKLAWGTQVFVVVFVWRLSSANYFPCVDSARALWASFSFRLRCNTLWHRTAIMATVHLRPDTGTLIDVNRVYCHSHDTWHNRLKRTRIKSETDNTKRMFPSCFAVFMNQNKRVFFYLWARFDLVPEQPCFKFLWFL